MKPNAALNLIRTNPQEAFKTCAFAIDHPNDGYYNVGGMRSIAVTEIGNALDPNMFKLTLSAGGSDCYYFPYLNTGTPINGRGVSVGHCIVPVNVPVGTIVVSGGMNGCSLQVNLSDDGRQLIFMHDNNGKGMLSLPDKANVLALIQESGSLLTTLDNPLCRVDVKHYMGPDSPATGLGLGYMLLTQEKYLKFAYYPFVIKTGETRWEVYFSPIGTTHEFKDEKIEGTYLRNLYLVSSFEIE